MNTDSENFLMSIIVAGVLTYLITFIELWQLIVIPGLMAGVICYEKPKKGIYGGALGITIAWSAYMITAILTKNTYTSIDQFAGVIFGGLGFGWIFIAIIILLGILFGALGGAIGAGTTLLIKIRQESKRESTLQRKTLSERLRPTKKKKEYKSE